MVTQKRILSFKRMSKKSTFLIAISCVLFTHVLKIRSDGMIYITVVCGAETCHFLLV